MDRSGVSDLIEEDGQLFYQIRIMCTEPWCHVGYFNEHGPAG